jgi:hypothetical protein
VYLTPDDESPAPRATTMPEIELWCFSCRSMYPHELADDA